VPGPKECLKIETRLLPKATPELNAMDHYLWRHTKRVTLGSRATLSIEASALAACQYLIDLSPRERLRKAGGLVWQLLVNSMTGLTKNYPTIPSSRHSF